MKDGHVATRQIYLPQTITITREGKTLGEALESRSFPNMRDDRDVPGTIDAGTSRLDANRYDHAGHPVPRFTDEYPEPVHTLHRSGYFGGSRTIEVVQVTGTPMSPPVAEAFVAALVDDPTHPFVQSHILPGIDLNGSDSYLSVKGPALAIPLTRSEEDVNARRRKDYVAPGPDGEERSLEVHVRAWDGLVSEDFLSAVRRHKSLSPMEVVVGTPELESLTPLQHSVGRGSLSGDERPMFKLTQDGRTVGFFGTPEEAQGALDAALEGVSYEGRTYLTDRNYRGEWTHDFAISGCIVKDGAEVHPKVSATLVEAEGVVRAEVAKVAPGRGGEVAGWLFVWQAPNWHRGGTMLRQELDGEGVVVRQYHEGY